MIGPFGFSRCANRGVASHRVATHGTPGQRGLVLLLLIVLAVPLRPVAAGGQTPRASAPGRGGWTAVRVAKWALLGAATGFGVYALAHSSRADRSYGDLRTLCTREPGACTLAQGRYAAPEAEALYQGSRREDRRAQIGIVGGQLTLLGSVALFLYDLRNDRGPANIPYPGAQARRAWGHGVAVGAAVRF